MSSTRKKIVQFKNQLAKDVQDLVDAPIDLFDPKPRDFTQLFNENQERFYKELEEANMKVFDQVT